MTKRKTSRGRRLHKNELSTRHGAPGDYVVWSVFFPMVTVIGERLTIGREDLNRLAELQGEDDAPYVRVRGPDGALRHFEVEPCVGGRIYLLHEVLTRNETSRGRRVRKNTALDDLELVQGVAAVESSLREALRYTNASYDALAIIGDRQKALDNLIWATQWLSQASTLRMLLNEKGGSSVLYRGLARIEPDFDDATRLWASLCEKFRSAI